MPSLSEITVLRAAGATQPFGSETLVWRLSWWKTPDRLRRSIRFESIETRPTISTMSGNRKALALRLSPNFRSRALGCCRANAAPMAASASEP